MEAYSWRARNVYKRDGTFGYGDLNVLKSKILFFVFTLILGILIVILIYNSTIIGLLGGVSFPLESEPQSSLTHTLVDANGVLIANFSLQVASGPQVSPGKVIIFNLNVTRANQENTGPFIFIYEIVNANSNQSFLRKDERVESNGSFILESSLGLPDIVPEGNYLFLVNISASENSVVISYPITVERMIATPWLQEHLSFFLSIIVVAFVIFSGIYYVFWLRRGLLKKKYEERQKNSPYPFPDFFTLPQSKYAYVGIVADSDEKAYLDHTQLNRHTLIAGGTGSGKTIAGMVIAEELLKRNLPVIVFDPVGQWSGFAKKNADEHMRKRYNKFGLGLPQSFNPRVIEITDATMHVDITHYLFMKGMTVFRLDKLTPRKVDEFIDMALSQIYRANLSESGSLQSLIVLDEVHRLLPKYGGRRAYTRLEQAVREFRKWGVGLLMVSQVLTDFKGAIRGNIGTEIQVHTRYEGDIKRVRERHGAVISNLIAKLPTGLSMVECADYNKGLPYFIEFRPLLHSPYKLTEAEMKKLVKKGTLVLRMD